MESYGAQVLVEVLLIVSFLDGEILELPIDEKMWVLGTSWHLREQLTNRKKDVLSIIVPDGVRIIARWVFEGCTALTSVRLPESLTGIGIGAFSGCTSLVYVAIPVGVTEIGQKAFYHCTSLVSVAIPVGVTTIGSSAFSGCTSLVSVSIPDGVTTIGNGSFFQCSSLASAAIPEGVTEIGYRCFNDCTSLVSLSLPSTLTKIGDHAFENCISLPEIALPEGLTKIETNAFENCRSLVTVTFPKNAKKIGYAAFENCRSLVSVVLPLRCIICKNAFFCCPLLSLVVATEIVLPPKWVSLDVPAGRLGLEEVFERCLKLSGPAYTTPCSPSAVATALGLEYWTPMTHHLCRTRVRSQAAHMILVLFRLELPIVVILKILRMFKRHEIGPP